MWSRQPGQLSVRAVLRHFAPYKGLVSLAGSALRSPPQARPPLRCRSGQLAALCSGNGPLEDVR